ncbi:hypothetical protein [Streptomyces sp. MP131-18]|nr:hypothetical protein [Streptomyces sp. MP131-18]ONK10342.1 hypothetical protein STBA_10640 [Streptomyces sp. MP131-18]
MSPDEPIPFELTPLADEFLFTDGEMTQVADLVSSLRDFVGLFITTAEE